MSHPSDQSSPPSTQECPGCGGRNHAGVADCEWCGRPFGTPGDRLRLTLWQVISSVVILAVIGAVIALAWLNLGRSIPSARPTVVPTVAVPPTLAVTPRVISQASVTPRPTQTVGAADAVPSSAPTPQPRAGAIGNTGGTGVTVRAEPGPQAPAIGSLREGAAVTLTGGEQTVAARAWVEVQGVDQSLKGWVLQDYVTVAAAAQP